MGNYDTDYKTIQLVTSLHGNSWVVNITASVSSWDCIALFHFVAVKDCYITLAYTYKSVEPNQSIMKNAMYLTCLHASEA